MFIGIYSHPLEVHLKIHSTRFENDEFDRKKYLEGLSFIIRGEYKINTDFLSINICIFLYFVHNTISAEQSFI
jgi:hypothetical protein